MRSFSSSLVLAMVSSRLHFDVVDLFCYAVGMALRPSFALRYLTSFPCLSGAFKCSCVVSL
jgi:hypothetical protein